MRHFLRILYAQNAKRSDRMEKMQPQKAKLHPKPQKKIRLPAAKAAVEAYCAVGEKTDPQGSYTGRVNSDLKARPVQDADDL
jgi:hypothetical protein